MAAKSKARIHGFTPGLQTRRAPTLIHRKRDGFWLVRFRHQDRTRSISLGISSNVLRDDEVPARPQDFVFEGGKWIPREVHEKFSAEYRLPYIRGTYNPWDESRNPLFVEAKETFLERYSEQANTQRSYSGVLGLLEGQITNPHARLSHVRSDDIVAVIDSPTLKSPASRQSYWRQLRAFFNWCVDVQYLDEKQNPFERVQKPSGPREVSKQFLSPEGYEAVLEALRRDYKQKLKYLANPKDIIWVEPVFELAISTGLRRDELAAMQWQDIRPELGTIEVRPKQQSRDGIDFMPKGKRARRIELHPRAEWTLEKLRDEYQVSGPLDFVLRSPLDNGEGNASIRANVEKASDRWREYRKKVPKAVSLKFHDLRGLFITYLLILDYSPYLVQNWAGHTDIKVTMGYSRFAHEVASSRMRRELRERLVAFGFNPPTSNDRA